MKELQGTSANLALIEGKDDKLLGSAEIILILSEPTYQPDGGGGLAKIRVTEQVRFAIGAKQLRYLVDKFLEIIVDIEDLEERATLAPKEEA